jgi:hypothetical protein
MYRPGALAWHQTQLGTARAHACTLHQLASDNVRANSAIESRRDVMWIDGVSGGSGLPRHANAPNEIWIRKLGLDHGTMHRSGRVGQLVNRMHAYVFICCWSDGRSIEYARAPCPQHNNLFVVTWNVVDLVAATQHLIACFCRLTNMFYLCQRCSLTNSTAPSV